MICVGHKWIKTVLNHLLLTVSVSICFNHTIADPDSCWDSTIIALTYWRILLVQFLLLREEVQTLPERDLPSRTPLGDGQWQIAEHIKRVGVVRADWAMQWAPQLAWEQICRDQNDQRSALTGIKIMDEFDWSGSPHQQLCCHLSPSASSTWQPPPQIF